MESKLHHWDQECGIRIAFYVLCTVAIAFAVAFSLYILR